MIYRNWLAPLARLTRTDLNAEPERPAVARMPGYAALMTVTEEQFGSLKEDIRALSGTVSEILHAVRDQGFRVMRMDERLSRVEGGLNLMDGRLTRVEGRLDKVDGRIDGLQGSVSEILTLARRDSAGGQPAGSVDVGSAG